MENEYVNKYVDEYIKSHISPNINEINNVKNIFTTIIWKLKNKFMTSTVLSDMELLINKSKIRNSLVNSEISEIVYNIVNEKMSNRLELYNEYLKRSFNEILNNIKSLDMSMIFNINFITEYFNEIILLEYTKEIEKVVINEIKSNPEKYKNIVNKI